MHILHANRVTAIYYAIYYNEQTVVTAHALSGHLPRDLNQLGLHNRRGLRQRQLR